MVLRRAENPQCGQARYTLLSDLSLPHGLAQLYGTTGPFTPADLGAIAARVSMQYKSGPILMSRNRSLRFNHDFAKLTLPRNQLPDA